MGVKQNHLGLKKITDVKGHYEKWLRDWHKSAFSNHSDSLPVELPEDLSSKNQQINDLVNKFETLDELHSRLDFLQREISFVLKLKK